MKFENFLTSRILNYQRYKNSVSSPIIKISIISIVIAVTVINFSLSIGFGIQMRLKIILSIYQGIIMSQIIKMKTFQLFSNQL